MRASIAFVNHRNTRLSVPGSTLSLRSFLIPLSLSRGQEIRSKFRERVVKSSVRPMVSIGVIFLPRCSRLSLRILLVSPIGGRAGSRDETARNGRGWRMINQRARTRCTYDRIVDQRGRKGDVSSLLIGRGRGLSCLSLVLISALWIEITLRAANAWTELLLRILGDVVVCFMAKESAFSNFNRFEIEGFRFKTSRY